MSITWILFGSPGLWDKFDLYRISTKGDQLFKFRYPGMEDLQQKFLLESFSVNMEFLENNTGKITAVAYLISISEIVNSVQQIGAGALLIVNNYILGLSWRNDSIYLFDSHSKDENGDLSSSATAVFLKFDVILAEKLC